VPVVRGVRRAVGQWFNMPDQRGHIVSPNWTPDRETGAGAWAEAVAGTVTRRKHVANWSLDSGTRGMADARSLGEKSLRLT